ncbi:MAG TPA: hypothetical protein VKP04_03610 [Ktedonobacteraceae bacterium]|nr:hypothetical protein [Ktedonobacteraceae bacterium]
MSRFINRKSVLSLLIALTLVAAFTGGILLRGSPTTTRASGTQNTNPLCAKLDKSLWGSAGMHAWCFGAQPSTASAHTANGIAMKGSLSANVNAANPHEDVSPAGVQNYGQSETSVAGVGPYVVEAWNDSTGFSSPCPSPMSKEELTGFGFSANGGKSFVDEGGLPNANCSAALLQGDPTVEAWRPGGSAYFYVGSLFNPTFTNPDTRSFIAVNACKATGTGTAAQISCGQPIIVAASSQCTSFCSFLDKEFFSIDPVRGRLYTSYTEFLPSGGTQEELAVCDIGTATGGTGSAGGTAGTPVCFNGGAGSPGAPSAPYFIVAPPDANGCENEGSYPSVDVKTGNVYIAFEHNDAALFGGVCGGIPVQEIVNYVPASCLALTATSPCAGPAKVNAVSINSMQAAFIPGYNRFPMNDFPRIAVSDKFNTVSIVWNDTRLHPAGDILMQSFNLVALSGVQTAPVRINSSTGGWHMLPGLRNANANGDLNISFYGRSSANTDVTNVFVALNVNPRTTSSPGTNALVTNKASAWLDVSSDIVPNFGDYTDNYIIATPSAPSTGSKLYIAWSDGRLGDPQPFEANTSTH